MLTLIGYDLVLGVQWLRTLGPIVWDFAALTMHFTMGTQNVTLQGMAAGSVHIATKKQASKLNYTSKGRCALLMTTVSEPTEVLLSTLLQKWPKTLQTLLLQFSTLFETPKGLPPPRTHDHKILLVDENQTVKLRPYRYPAVQKDEIERMVVEMKDTGIIRDSTSSFASPVILVKKKDGSWRLCIDYRQLNRLTIKDKFPIPLVEEFLDELAGATFFSKLDLRSGYHQIRMNAADIHKTAFRTHHGHYEFLVMPFGLTNAPSTFQSLMNHVFEPYLRRFVLVFFDDILIFSATWDEHLLHLRIVFETLIQHQLYVKLSKCDFGAKQVEYLGHVISSRGVAMDATKISCIVQWPYPHSIKELRGFLGLTGYYRRFIQNYGSIAQPLTSLLKKNAFQWSSTAQTA